VKKIFIKILIPVDFIFSIILFITGYFFYIYRRIGSSRLTLSTKVLRWIGVFPIINHYYEPLFHTDRLKNSTSLPRNLPGLKLNVGNQLMLLEKMAYAQELIDLELDKTSTNVYDFKLKNGSFESGDAEFLYQFIRYFKPNKVIEIGSGNSTKIANKALNKNLTETAIKFEHICIEPYEMEWLEDIGDLTVIREKVEELSLDWSDALNSGDLLFIDSSHIIRPQGDVLFEVLEILPRLKAGVFIHIHDIFTPRDYLSKWLVEDIKFWNEQYIIEAILSNSNKFEIIAALNLLKNEYYDSLKCVCPYLDKSREPGSLYLRVL